jgi:hypothetical protein
MGTPFTTVELSAGAVLFAVALISVYCSSMILRIINRMSKWNGYLVLIFSMTICELIYDCTFFLLIGYHNNIVFKLVSFVFAFSGLSVALWSNVLSAILLFMVSRYAPLDIWSHYRTFFCVCTIPSLIFATFNCIFAPNAYVSATYNILRFASISFNVIVYLAITWRLKLGAVKGSRAIGPLRELASRYKYYPIVQIICRVPTTAYQLRYGFGFDSFKTASLSDTSQLAALFVYALTAPSGGILYFFVFLFMQPRASVEYRTILIERWNGLVGLLPRWICGCCVINIYDSLSTDDSGDGARKNLNREGESAVSSNFVGGDHRSSGHRKTPQATLGRFAEGGFASDELINPLNGNGDRAFSGNEIEVGGIFLTADDCWQHYKGMDEDELESNILSDDSR